MGNDTVSRRQLLAMAYICMLSPAIRLVPRLPAALGGRAVWLSPLAAALGAGGIGFLFSRCLAAAGPGRGLAELICAVLGRKAGRAVLGLYALWFTLDAGFILRTAEERLISAVYSEGHLAAFLLLTLFVALVAARGRLRALGRTAEVFAPVIVVILAVILVAAAPDMNAGYLLPVVPADVPQILLGALPMVEVMGVLVPLAFFGDMQGAAERPGSVWRWAGAAAVSAAILTVPVIGVLSAAVVQRLQHPFFIMLRNIVLFSSAQRIEPTVIVLWVVTDFMFVAVLLMLSAHLTGKVTGKKRRKLSIYVSAALALAAAFACGKSAFDMYMLSDVLVPAVNFVFWIVLPLFFLCAAAVKRARRKKEKSV